MMMLTKTELIMGSELSDFHSIADLPLKYHELLFLPNGVVLIYFVRSMPLILNPSNSNNKKNIYLVLITCQDLDQVFYIC